MQFAQQTASDIYRLGLNDEQTRIDAEVGTSLHARFFAVHTGRTEGGVPAENDYRIEASELLMYHSPQL